MKSNETGKKREELDCLLGKPDTNHPALPVHYQGSIEHFGFGAAHSNALSDKLKRAQAILDDIRENHWDEISAGPCPAENKEAILNAAQCVHDVLVDHGN